MNYLSVATNSLVNIFLQTEKPFYVWGILINMGDTMDIYDGPDDQSEKIESLNGKIGSFSILSHGSSLYVKFNSLSTLDFLQYTGFFATIHYGNL